MKFRKSVKQEALGIPLKHAGEVTIINEQSTRRTITNTLLGELDTKERDPNNPDRNRPWGDVVAMRRLLAGQQVETLSSVYGLIKS